MQRYRLLLALIVSLSIYFVDRLLELNLFKKLISILKSIEKNRLQDIIIPVFIFCLFLFWDRYMKNQKLALKHAKLSVYRAMLSTSHHIINTFLYQMDIFKLTAEDTPGFDTATLAYYEDIKNDTSEKIHSLSNINEIDENTIKNSVLNK